MWHSPSELQPETAMCPGGGSSRRHQTHLPSPEPAQRAHGSQAHPSAVTRCLPQCINHELCIQLVLQGVKIFLHLEISKKLISKPVAFSLMPPEGLEGVTCMDFFADCCQAYAECQAPVALPVHKRMLQIPEMTVFLAGARRLQPRQ